ncbi:hypothetical protein G5V59_25600 [Nocardioides sp. W3-2-3]|uniref:hypothetical protein n=1 Tax=Nocardioides convexus TaxID=2712224 RepID=UPI0024189E4E|nr:hypothetical protein [Nocardioides convexus]NHA01877.1 hypothetical protein [Nocardioides convexus]
MSIAADVKPERPGRPRADLGAHEPARQHPHPRQQDLAGGGGAADHRDDQQRGHHAGRPEDPAERQDADLDGLLDLPGHRVRRTDRQVGEGSTPRAPRSRRSRRSPTRSWTCW